MPLSEHEQRLLEEMERSLYRHDVDDVTTVGRRARASYTAILLGILGGLAGLALLVVGVIVRQPIVGLLGFVLMFGGALFAIAPPRRFTVAVDDPARPGSSGNLTERSERRDRD